jgi:predicted nucleic acid-binding Zn ribbon protein
MERIFMAAKSEPNLLGTLLKELFQRKKWQQHLEQHKIFLIWEDIVGAGIAAHATPDCIRSKVLWLKVTDSVWMQQLHLEKRMLLATINEQLREQELQDIRFRLETRMASRPPEAVAGKSRGEQVSTRDLNLFEEMILPLRDEELKATMRRLWLKGQNRKHGL